MEFEEYLQKLATQRGLKQKHLAERTSVKKSAVNHWWHGVSRPQGQNAVDLARVLGVEPADLIEAAAGNVHKLDKYLDSDGSTPKAEIDGSHQLVHATSQAPMVDGKLVATTPDFGRHSPIGYRAIQPEFSEIADRLIYFRALDNSMYSPSIRKSLNIGDVALIELGATPTPGDLVLCILAGADEAILRVYKARGKGDFDLAPYNEDWASVSVSDPASCKILGVSREVHIKL